jgi:hypothetical protein
VNEANVIRIDAEHFVRDLRECRLETLPVRMGADAKLQHAVRREPCDALLVSRHHGNAPAVVHGSAVRRLLTIDRDADSDAATVRLAVLLPHAPFRHVERGHGAPHRFRVIA